jgi:hypothetical protein
MLHLCIRGSGGNAHAKDKKHGPGSWSQIERRDRKATKTDAAEIGVGSVVKHGRI